MAKDPVSMNVKPNEILIIEYNKKIYFCSKSCIEVFKKEHQLYNNESIKCNFYYGEVI